MMNSNDLRVMKTQSALMNSFLELLKTKNFKQITVQDLCDRAMVRRSTFYRHYNDKYDLLNEIVGNFFNKIHESHSDSLLVKQPQSYFENIVRDTLYLLLENKDTIQSLFTISYYDEVSRIVYKQLYKGVERQVDFDIRHVIRFSINLEAYKEFMAWGILRIIYSWLKEGQKRSIDDLTIEVVKIINGIRETHIKKF